MSLPSQLPRDYQIAELTRGTQFPLPLLQRRHIKIIAELLVEAWDDLLETQEHILRTKFEPDVNALIKTRVNKIRGNKTEWAMLVLGVSLGSESCNHDASSIEKRPDMSVHLTDRSFDFPLIVECKLIDTNNKKGVDLYCQDGIARFIDGKYAWYAREAFMLAYVRDGASIETCLTPHLEKNQQKTPDPFLTEQLPKPISFLSHELAQSHHGRRFPDNPGQIDVWHLWLS